VYNGAERLQVDGIDVWPAAMFLDALFNGKILPWLLDSSLLSQPPALSILVKASLDQALTGFFSKKVATVFCSLTLYGNPAELMLQLLSQNCQLVALLFDLQFATRFD
jgi:hypothetical protein